MTDNITLPREAVEKIHEAWSSEVYPPAASMEWYDIMDALRTALAAEQPKPEPVAWMLKGYSPDVGPYFDFRAEEEMSKRHRRKEWTPLYAAPPEAEALRRDAERLTDEQIDSATSKERDDLLDHIYEYGTAAEGILERIRKLARAAIDAAMKEGT